MSEHQRLDDIRWRCSIAEECLFYKDDVEYLLRALAQEQARVRLWEQRAQIHGCGTNFDAEIGWVLISWPPLTKNEIQEEIHQGVRRERESTTPDR